MALRSQANPIKGCHHLDRVAADRALGRKHDGIGTVQHRIGYIGNLCTRWLWTAHHRLHHLRRGDHNGIMGARFTNEALLHPRYFSITDLDAEIPARHHDDV